MDTRRGWFLAFALNDVVDSQPLKWFFEIICDDNAGSKSFFLPPALLDLEKD